MHTYKKVLRHSGGPLRHISLQGPTSQDGVMALCLLSSLSCGESLQRAAIISFQTAEEEEVL